MPETIAHKAILIYPEFDTQDTFWSYERSLKMYSPPGEFGLPKRLLPPLGLMGLYRYLRPFYEQIQLIDRNVDPRPFSSLIDSADHIYLGGMLTQEKALTKYAALAKQAGKKIIVGGPVVARDSPIADIADYLVENEAEQVIDEVLQALRTGEGKKFYRSAYVDAENFFQPDFSSINMQNYVHMALQISRGCPENCEFCDAPARFGKSYRVTPWEKTADAFKQMLELGWKGPVFIVDDNFIGNPKIALEVLKKLYQIGETLGFHHSKYTELTLRLADDLPIMRQLRHWLRRCCFFNGFYGVETPNKAALQETDKRQNLRGDKTLTEKLTALSQYTGSGVMMGIIYGFDHDTETSADELIEFVNASNVPIVMAGLLNALPGTDLLTRLRREGRYLEASSRNNSDGVINFIPYNFSVQQAERNYLRIMQAIYSPEAYFARVMRHLQLIDPNLQHNPRPLSEKLAFLAKIMSRENAAIYWHYLPQALRIAKRRFAVNSPQFNALFAEYIALCGQYTHFVGQIRKLAERFTNKPWQPWQQISWLQILASDIDRVELLAADPSSPLLDKIQLHTRIQYPLRGTRLQIFQYLAEPYILEGFKNLPNHKLPGLEQFIDIEINAFRRVYTTRPNILSSFAELEHFLRDGKRRPADYLQNMRRRYRKALAIAQYT